MTITSLLIISLVLNCKSENKQIQSEIVTTKTLLKSDTIFQKKWEDKSFFVERYSNTSSDAITQLKLKFTYNNKDNTIIYQDSISECPVEYDMNFLTNSFEIGDFNKNNKEEVIFAYKYYCKGDISPENLKLIVLENNNILEFDGTVSSNLLPDSKPILLKKTSSNHYYSAKWFDLAGVEKEKEVKSEIFKIEISKIEEGYFKLIDTNQNIEKIIYCTNLELDKNNVLRLSFEDKNMNLWKKIEVPIDLSNDSYFIKSFKIEKYGVSAKTGDYEWFKREVEVNQNLADFDFNQIE